ncbi:unnamed protein product [Arabidopsis halleri]
MEPNKEEEAKRALDIADRKLSKNEYNRAKRYAKRAQRLYPKLCGLEQVLVMIDVYISASNNGGTEEPDWYRILGVDSLSDDEAVKKRYKKLALLLHPDKNRFNGAEGAFKLVLQAWDLLSDKSKRISYDQKRKSKQVRRTQKHKPTEPEKPASSYRPTPTPEPKPRPTPNMPKPSPEPDIPMPMPTRPKPKPKPDTSLTTVKVGTFWTVCNVKECKTYCEFMRASCLNRTVPCPNCGKYFIATVIPSELINGRLVIRLSPSNQSTWKSTSDTSSTSAMAKVAPERVKRWFNPMPELDSSMEKEKKLGTFWTVCNRCKTHCKLVRANYLNKTFPCPNCCQEFVAAEMIIEIINGGPVIKLSPSVQSNSKSSKRTSDASSKTSASDKAKTAYQKEEILKREKIDPDVASAATGGNVQEAETLFKEPMTTGNENSTTEAGNVKEAETLFEEPMTTGNENSTPEAVRLFKKPMTTGNANSSLEAEKLFKKPMSTGDENSTHEAQRLFKKPMTTGNANSNLEAQRCFLRIWQREMQSRLLK